MQKIDKLTPYFFFMTMFTVFYFLNYQQVFSLNYESDTREHIEILKQYFTGDKYIPHPLWHYGTYWISKIGQIQLENSAVIFSSLLMLSWVMIIFYFIRHQFQPIEKLKSFNNGYYILLTLVILMVGPLIIPGEYIIYLGKGSPNIWHNITIWMVKPFAFFTIISLLIAWQSKDTKYYFFAYILSVISLFAKPSFIIIFLPSIFLVAIINKYFTKYFWIFYTVLGLTSLIILLYQFSNTFSESEVIFDFLGVWSTNSSNIALSIILGLAFPLLFVMLNRSILEEPLFQIVWIQVFIGITLYALFAQTGKQYLHGNFSWSYMIAMNLLYVFSILKFTYMYQKITALKRYLLSSILLIQTIIGTYYFIQILQGQNPIYISFLFLR